MIMHESEEPSVRAEDAKGKFAEALQRAAKDKERVVVTRRGRPVAALVPMRDVRALERLEDERDLADARAALAEAKREGTISWETIKKRHRL